MASLHSIRTITNILLGLFVALFLIIIVFSYRQLSETENSYSHIANNVVPTLADNGIIHSQLTALAFLVSSFSQSKNAPEMRVNERQVNEKIEEIYRLMDAESAAVNDLKTVEAEFELLKDAMTQSLSLQQVEIRQQGLISQQMAQGPDAVRYSIEISQSLFAVHTAIGQLFQAERLMDLRNQESRINGLFSQLYAQSEQLEEINLYLKAIQELTFGDEGYTSIKAKIMRERARIEGQSNFIRRFVLDIAKDAEFRAYQFAEQQALLTSNFARTTSQKFSILLAVYTLTFLIGFLLILYIKTRVVSRLVTLNQSIKAQAKRAILISRTEDKDEIGELTNTIANQFDTIEHQKNELTQISFVDSLTKVANRRAFTEHMKQILPLAVRNKIPLSVMLIDVDFFKQYNDEYGHVKGDETLLAVAQTLEKLSRRGTDFVARYGGEEFVCVLLGPSHEEAHNFAEQICEHIRALGIPHSASLNDPRLTVSIGICTEPNPDEAATERLIQCADTALYQAKTQGRDRVVDYKA
ncbi:sensor domain-containing diguanylate cyclase [Alteromonas flava]|uniref:GGDEF domain-containing protein n=1 Tax=Alteromonas flava TaxID=2048003 RepID=UPI0013DAFB5C|nr:GGDEF domain-containing protein [Alteromonas flava]